MKDIVKLLLVEDDAIICYFVKNALQDLLGRYEVMVATNGIEGLKAYKEFNPDIIISDVNMPEMNGFEMVKCIRETDGDTPILFASGLHSPRDVKNGFSIGVNNYIKKPFMPDELDAHIRAILKMKEGARNRNETEFYRFGCYTLDADHAILRNDVTKQQLPITPRECSLLQLLVQNKNEVVRRNVILSRIWQAEEDYFASRSLDVFVSKLRRLFVGDESIEIKTVRGVGVVLKIQK